LNFVEPSVLLDFFRDVMTTDADALVITGDIGESRDLTGYLRKLDDVLQRPLYFVLGNHDFYFGSIAEVRARVAALCADRPRLRYLTLSDGESLTPHVALVGHDGWADARLGDYERSLVMMNDYKLIAELAPYGKAQRWARLKELGDEAAAHLARVLPLALRNHEHVFLATHVPPFREACWHEGRISDDEWAPHFTCQATGNVIRDTMGAFPDRRLTVLCGHTHGSGECHPLPNVRVITGGAEYGFPRVCDRFEL
jgi:3',5'-cyclic AMP phosphodiesterase CpdA